MITLRTFFDNYLKPNIFNNVDGKNKETTADNLWLHGRINELISLPAEFKYIKKTK